MNFLLGKKTVHVEKKFENLDLSISKLYFKPCTLTEGNAYVIVLLNTPYQGKKTLFLSKDWSKKTTKNEDDSEYVDNFNEEIIDFLGIEDDNICDEDTAQFDCVVNNTFEMHTVFCIENYLFCPEASWVLALQNVNAIFMERMSSYTRTFDVSFMDNSRRIAQLSAIHRKEHRKTIEGLLPDALFVTGPDPIEWRPLLQLKRNKNLSWSDVHKEIENQVEAEEDSGSEWQAGETEDDESEDVDEWIDLEAEEEEEAEEESSDESSEEETELSDYDKWELSSKKRSAESVTSPNKKPKHEKVTT